MMKHIQRFILLAGLFLVFCAATDVYSQFRVALGARYWLSSYYSDTGELDGVEFRPGHQFAPVVRVHYKYVWTQFTIFWGWTPFRYEGHYEVFLNTDGDEMRHGYVGQKTNARRIDWNIALGLDISPKFGIFLLVREVKFSVKDDFNYTEYEYQPLSQEWKKLTTGSERVVWTNNKTAFGGGLFWDFPLKAVPLAFQLRSSYLVVSGSGGLERFEDLISLYGGIRYTVSRYMALQAGYRMDMLGIDKINEAHHGLIIGVLIPLYQ
jgi:hypothetical protein